MADRTVLDELQALCFQRRWQLVSQGTTERRGSNKVEHDFEVEVPSLDHPTEKYELRLSVVSWPGMLKRKYSKIQIQLDTGFPSKRFCLPTGRYVQALDERDQGISYQVVHHGHVRLYVRTKVSPECVGYWVSQLVTLTDKLWNAWTNRD